MTLLMAIVCGAFAAEAVRAYFDNRSLTAWMCLAALVAIIAFTAWRS